MAHELDTIVSHQLRVSASNNTPIITLLHGSQNYNLASESSDVDTMSLVMPSSILQWAKTGSYNLEDEGDNGGIASFKDFRDFVTLTLKQNFNFLETFHTKFFAINPVIFDSLKMSSALNTFMETGRNVWRANPQAGLKAMSGFSYQQVLLAKKLTDTDQQTLKKKAKLLARTYYFHKMLRKVHIEGQTFGDALVASADEQAMYFRTRNHPDEIHLDKIISILEDEDRLNKERISVWKPNEKAETDFINAASALFKLMIDKVYHL